MLTPQSLCALSAQNPMDKISPVELRGELAGADDKPPMSSKVGAGAGAEEGELPPPNRLPKALLMADPAACTVSPTVPAQEHAHVKPNVIF